jgi:hypothetical protein
MPIDRIDGEIIFDIDYNAVEQALRYTGWITGWNVTGNSTTLSVDVSAGSGRSGGTFVSTSASTNLALSEAHPTNPRKDLVIWDSSAGSLAVVTGTAQAVSPGGETDPRKMVSPLPPDITDPNDIIIAVVYVPAGATKGTDCTIIDKRVAIVDLISHSEAVTGVHGAGSYYLALAPSPGHLVGEFTKGWTADKILLGAGSNTPPIEIDGVRTKLLTATRVWNAPSANVSYTGVGFRPTAIVAFAGHTGYLGIVRSWGFADSAGSSYSLAVPATGNQFTSSFLIMAANTLTTYQAATVYSYDSDGFTLSWTNVGITGSGSVSIIFLCLR